MNSLTERQIHASETMLSQKIFAEKITTAVIYELGGLTDKDNRVILGDINTNELCRLTDIVFETIQQESSE